MIELRENVAKKHIKLMLKKGILIFFLFCFSSLSSAQDFTVKNIGDHGNVTVMEVTGNYDGKNSDGTINSVPREQIAKEFFSTHKDEYDFIVIFSNFDFRMPDANARAFYLHVKNDTNGIGKPLFDNSSFFGSDGKLQGIIDMGNVATLVTNPLDPKFEETLSILAHEQMHRWGAYVRFEDSNGNISASLLGKDDEHWSFLLNSYGSVLYGNYWCDNDDGTFTSKISRKYYSPLDLYLMGLYDRTHVPPMLLIVNPDVDPAKMPLTGTTITGTPRYINIDDIIGAEGERIPSLSDSQKTFKTAFIFITAPGIFTGDELYGIENIRNGWITRFSVLTDGKGLLQVVSSLKENIPANPGIPLSPSDPRTLPPIIEDGVKWLMSIQRADGNWIDLALTTERDTAETVHVLRNFPVAEEEYSSGLQWLGSDDSENSDYLSRKIEALAVSGQDIGTLIDLLVSRQNGDGGWGSNSAYLSNTTDTLLALKALSAAGYNNQSTLSAAIEYLKTKQNPDGGWGSNEKSSIESTANVLTAFNKYRNNYQLQDKISRGIAWLVQRQNPDGGFGNSPSTVYDTAFAVLALRAYNVSTDITNNGINYILNLQSEDGSWYESPYQTALAINTVWKATIDPDLSVKTEDITFIPPVITSLPTEVVMNVNIWNLGKMDVAQAKVVLYKDAVDEANKIGEQVLAFPGQSSVTATFFVTIPDRNEHRFYVSVDPEDLIGESNETNNVALNIIKPQATYDFEILPSDITVSQNPVDIFQDVTITSKITNKGTMNAYNVHVRYYINEAGTPFDIATKTVDIPANSTISNEVVWRSNRAGENLLVTVKADPFDSYTEISEDNNQAVTNLTVNGATEPNLTISYSDMLFTPDPAEEGEKVAISAIVKNEGFSSANNFPVLFYRGDPSNGGMLLGSSTVSLGAGENTTVSIDWNNIMVSGETVIYIKVDPENQITEIKEDDNDAFAILNILSLPDLTISAGSIYFSPPAPKEGDIVSIGVMVKNAGEQDVGCVSVAAYEGNITVGSPQSISISGNSQAVATFTYDTTGKNGMHTITIVADPDNVINEQKDTNNSASRTFGVQDANLWVTEQYISPNGDSVKDSTEFFFRLNASQTVKVVVVNGKGETVRTFSGSEFDNITAGSIIWDGLDDDRMVVDDGQYKMAIINQNNNTVGSLLITVDNNREPFINAIGSEYLLSNNMSYKIAKLFQMDWEWFLDESGILVNLNYFDSESWKYNYPKGLYSVSTDGQYVLNFIPEDRGIIFYKLSPDGEKIAFVRQVSNNELWIMDRYGSNLKLLDSPTENRRMDRYNFEWSPDGGYILYYLINSLNESEARIVKPDGSGKEEIGVYSILLDSARWSPDSSKVAYIVDYRVVKVYDVISKSTKDIFVSDSSYQFPLWGNDIEWLNNKKLIIVEDSISNLSEHKNLWLIDALDNSKNLKVVDDDSINKGSTKNFVAPDRNKFVYATKQNGIQINLTDIYADTSTLMNLNPDESEYISASSINANIVWSPDSEKIAIKIPGNCAGSCGAKLITIDVETKKEESFTFGRSYYPARWLGDNKTLVIIDGTYNTYYLKKSETRELGEYIQLPTREGYTRHYLINKNEIISPLENFIAYADCKYNRQSGCTESNLLNLRSLLNLTSELKLTKNSSTVSIKCIAQDLNFERYKIEYADANNTGEWHLVTPPSDRPVIDDIVTSWVPPSEGTFYVQLTAWDRAGNVSRDRKLVTWAFKSSITNIYKSYEIFSPNGDGLRDTADLHYTALEPVHLEFKIYDETDNLARTFCKDHAAYAVDKITWDGKDESGQIVPDGKYKIKVLGYEFFVDVDSTPPEVGLTLTDIMQDFNAATGNGTGFIYAELSGHAIDNKLKNWKIEYGEGHNPQAWYEYDRGESLLVKKDDAGYPLLNPVQDALIYRFFNSTISNEIEWLVGKKFKITAEDFAGNKSAYITDSLDEEVVLHKWNNAYLLLQGGAFHIEFGNNSVSVLDTVEEQIISLTIQYKKDNVWYDGQNLSLPVQGLSNNDWDSSQLHMKNGDYIRIKAVDITGNIYYSNESQVIVKPTACDDFGDPACNPDVAYLDFSLNVTYIEPACDSLSEKAVLSTVLRGFNGVSPRILSYFIEKTDGIYLLRQIDLSKEVWDSVILATLNMPEGSYPVKAVITYLDHTAHMIAETTVTNTLVIDRVLPNAQITYPDKSLLLCPVKVSDDRGNWYGLPVEGIATDNNQGGTYELYYGMGENPSVWMPATTRRVGRDLYIMGKLPVQGQIGNWDVTNLVSETYSLRLKVIDIAGNVSCYMTGLSMDALTEISDLASDKYLFSPNGDGVSDNVEVTYRTDEAATVNVKVYALIKDDDGYILNPTPLKTIVSEAQHIGGIGHATWDGKDGSNTVVGDGLYAMAVSVEDSCRNTSLHWIDVEVDNIPPSTLIAYPGPSDLLGNIVGIRGVASDINFLSYSLEIGRGDNPDNWALIAENNYPVVSDMLGTWNTYGLAGIWTIRLTARDEVGNESTATITIDLGIRQNLINDLSVTPRIFSPNNDGSLDTTQITYSITDSCEVSIDILDSDNAVRKTFSNMALPSGMYTLTWDGSDNTDAAVIDGVYTVKLRASLSSNHSVKQEEHVTVVIDSIPPTIYMSQPLDNAYYTGTFAPTGTISDISLRVYSVSYSGANGAVLLDKANQSRQDYTFGILNSLPEGNYVLNAVASDIGGNVAEINIPFTIDRTVPDVIFTAPVEGEFYGSAKSIIAITGYVSEINPDTYSLRYCLGDNPLQCTELLSGRTLPVGPLVFSWDVSSFADGKYAISLFVQDKAGLTGEARVGVIVDNTLPQTTITSPGEGSYIMAATGIEGTAYDLTLDTYTIEMSSGQCSSAYKWTPIKTSTVSVHSGILALLQNLPSDGDHCIRLTATDKLGSQSRASVNVKIDTIPPATPVLAANVENTSNVSLSWTQNTESDLAGYDIYRNDQKLNTGLAAGISYTDQNLSEGTYTYKVKAVDLAGNESSLSNEVKLRVDITGPDARISLPQNGSEVSANELIEIKGTAYCSDDFKQYRIYIGQGSNPASWKLLRSSPVPMLYGTLAQWDNLGLAGMYSIKLEAQDISGNISIHQIIVTIDDLPPAAPILISAFPNGSDVMLTWQANTEPDLAGYVLFRNGEVANASGTFGGDIRAYLINDTTYPDKALPDGKFIYSLIAMDHAGNISDQSNTIEVNIDTRPPQANIVEPRDGVEFDGKILVKAESSDLDIETVQFQYKRSIDTIWMNLGNPVAQRPYTVYLDPVTLGLTYDIYQLRAVATDKGWKTDSSPTFIAVTYTDQSAPQAPSGLKAITQGQNVTLTWEANTEADMNGYNIYRTSGSLKEKINSAIITESTYQDISLSDGTYTYEVTAIDIYDNESDLSNTVSVKVYAPVIEQPYTPTGQQIITINGSRAEVDSTVEIFIDTGSGPVSQGTASYDGQGNFIFNITFSIGENKITAKVTDSAGNISRSSDMVVVVYNEAPAAPERFVTSAQNYDVNLTWNPNTEPDLSGYNLYRDGEKVNLPVAITTGTITASSSYSSYIPSNALDLNPSTYWMSNYTYMTFNPVWLQITLPSSELISHIEINWQGETIAGKDYEIQVWTGYTWITHTKVTDNDQKNNAFDLIPSYRTDKIRICITDTTNPDNYKQGAISEIKILKDVLITETTYSDMNLLDGEHSYKITAVDYYGFESLPTDATTVSIGDVEPPSTPLSLQATFSASDVILNWSANTEPDMAGYNIYRNSPEGWIKINTTLIAETTYADSNLINGTYTYRVIAADTAGNKSLPSNEVSVTVQIALLQPPQNLNVASIPEGGVLSISWEYGGGNIAGYNLYRSTTPGGPYVKITSSIISGTFYFDAGLTNGVLYYYAVTAVDSIGNESAYSNEAMGVPSRTVVPPAPALFFPTLPDMPIVLDSDKTDIAGSAEPGTTINLFKDGISVDSTKALEKNIIQSFKLDYTVSSASLSPDGKTLAYIYNNNIWLKTLLTGEETQIIQNGYSLVWSPDGRKIACVFRDGNNYYRIGIFDVRERVTVVLTDDADVHAFNPSWTLDGTRIAFRSYKTGTGDIWLKDLIAGSFTQVTYGINSENPKISPDGKFVAYFMSKSLYIVDVATGNKQQVDTQADSNSLDWSPDSKKFVFKSYRNSKNDLFIFDIATNEYIQITDSIDLEYYPKWSPDGEKIVLGKYANYQYSIWMMVPNMPQEDRLIKKNPSGLSYLAWLRSGGIAFIEQTTLNLAYIQGHFSFEDIPLDYGENIFYAKAADSSERVSFPSDQISIISDTYAMPDMEVKSDGILIYPSYPLVGEKVIIDIYVSNKGKIAVNDLDADVYLYDSSGNLDLQKTARISHLSSYSTDVISIIWDSNGKAGTNSIIVVVDPRDRINELNEANNFVMRDIIVVETRGILMTTTLNSDTYGINQDVNISIKLNNPGIEKNVTVKTSIEDEGGNVLETLNPVEAHLPYASGKNIEHIWNTGATFAGKYRVHSVLMDSNGVLVENIVPFTQLPDKAIGSEIRTDRISYKANETAAITSAIRSTSRNFIFENLNVVVTIRDNQGTVFYTDSNTIDMLLPDQLVEFNTRWNTGKNVPGEYRIILEVREFAGTVLSASTKTLTISNVVLPSALLAGNISVDPKNLLQGDTVNISYSITNVGNIDLPQVNLSILTVHVVELTVYDTLTDHATLLTGEIFNNTRQLNTSAYSAKDYLVILRAKISGTEETLAGTYFRVQGAPSAPSLSSPQHGDDVETLTPVLTVNNASDPSDDELTYEFEIYSDIGLTNLIASSEIIEEGRDVTSWQVLSELSENATYCWRARAYDRILYGVWMFPASFRVNVENDPPTAPTLSSPADNAETDTLTPVLTVNNASDPDSSNLTYNFEVSLDTEFARIVASEIGIFEGTGTTSWQIPVPLNENTFYYWRTQADDWLIEGPWMSPARFFVDTANDAPTAPIILLPSNNDEITTFFTDIVMANSTDPDSSHLTYLFEIDTMNTFDSPNIIRSDAVPEGQGTTSWHSSTGSGEAVNLSDNTYYYVRAKASDGFAESPWSEVIEFFVNTVNDPPTAPVPANPSEGSGVNTFTLTLSVHNSTDIDRDVLTYEFEVYTDEAMTNLATNITGVEESQQITSWTVPVSFMENMTYYWRARAYDGELHSGWMPLSSFMVNTANDAPTAPQLYAPEEGSSIDTLNPALSVSNAADPDNDSLTYDFEIYDNGSLVQSITGIPQDITGMTSVTLTDALSDNTTYTWRVRAYDGDRYGAWMDMATFSIHLPSTNITATIDFEPNTLNQKSKGTWVTVYIELPSGYNVADIIISSIRLNGIIPAEPKPYDIGDCDHDERQDLMVKFKIADVINLLPNGDNVRVFITGTVDTTTFEGVDVIRVIH